MKRVTVVWLALLLRAVLPIGLPGAGAAAATSTPAPTLSVQLNSRYEAAIWRTGTTSLEDTVGAWCSYPATTSSTASPTATGTATATSTPVPPSTRVITYTYDSLQRLTGAVESPGSSFAYAYDLAGNRTGVTVNGTQTISQTYNAADQVVGWTYNGAGNLTNDGTTSYSYDAQNHLTGTTAGTQTNAYTYNGDGTLVGQLNNTTPLTYTQDLAASQSQILAATSGLTTTDYLYGQDTAPLTALSGGTRIWYGIDGQGSVRQTLDDTGSVLGVQNYDPFGTPENALTTPFGYTGELQNATTGQEYLRARWYQPGSGTLLGVDPALASTGQPYAYAGNDPVNRSDPSGNCWTTTPDRLLVYDTPPDPHFCTQAELATVGGKPSSHSYYLTPQAEEELTAKDATLAVDDAVRITSRAAIAADVAPLLGEAAASSAAEGLVAAEEAALPREGGCGWQVFAVGLVILGVTEIGIQLSFPHYGAPVGDMGPALLAEPTLVDTPTATPQLQTTPTVTATPTPQGGGKYVADSGIFQDRMISAQQRLAVEFYLQNPNNTIYVPKAVLDELGQQPSQTQWDRVTGFSVAARIVPVPNPSISQYDPSTLESGPFDENDMYILETARSMGLPLLTINRSLVNQIQAHNPLRLRRRAQIWGEVRILAL